MRFFKWLVLHMLYISRFTPEEKAKRHPCAYLPFGHGPRNCIGWRMGMLEMKMTLLAIVQKYKILPTPETEVRSRFWVGSPHFNHWSWMCASFAVLEPNLAVQLIWHYKKLLLIPCLPYVCMYAALSMHALYCFQSTTHLTLSHSLTHWDDLGVGGF